MNTMQTILAVDDEEENLMMVEHTLSNEYRVVAVNSGAMAIKYLHQEIPDLILLDIKMPQMDGFEVLNTIRESDQWMKIPVIFLTSYAKSYKDEELRQSGVADYIGKPIDSATMKHRIERTMTTMQSLRTKMAYKKLDMQEKPVQEVRFIPVIVDHIEVKLQADKISYVEEVDRNCIVHTRHMEVKTKLHMDKIEAILGDNFLRTDKKLLINIDYIKAMGDGKLIMENGRTVMLPGASKKAFSRKRFDGSRYRFRL